MKNPLILILTILFLSGILLQGCEYGPKHGKMNLSKKELRDILNGKAGPDHPAANNDYTEIKYNGQVVNITRHARCRMECRHIDAFEVQQVIDQDNVNERKSESLVSSGKCPTIAYEGITKDQQTVRVIVGDCKDNPKLITVIDLENEYECECEET